MFKVVTFCYIFFCKYTPHLMFAMHHMNLRHLLSFFFFRLSNCETAEPNEHEYNQIERFVILMYNRSSSIEEINEYRRYHFTKKGCPSESSPSTRTGNQQESPNFVIAKTFYFLVVEKSEASHCCPCRTCQMLIIGVGFRMKIQCYLSG